MINFTSRSKPSRSNRCLAALAIGCQLFLTTAYLKAATPADPSKWMQVISDQIGGVPLRAIAMPGTHDSAMYYGMADGDIAKTQTGDFTSQLNAGARWLDFRYLYLNNTTCGTVTTGSETLKTSNHTGWYMFGHSNRCINILVYDALAQISAFLQAHPQEIITLRMGKGGDSVTAAQIAAFQQRVVQILTNPATGQSYVYNDQVACKLGGGEVQSDGTCDDPLAPISPQNVTPNQLWSTSARVVLLESDGPFVGPLLGSWYDSNIEAQGGYYDPTGGTSNPEIELQWLEVGTPDGHPALFGDHPAYANWTSDPKMLYLSASMTPGGAGNFTQGGQTLSATGIFVGVSPVYQAESFNPILTGVIENNLGGYDKDVLLADLGPTQENWTPYDVNVVEMDNIACCGTAAAVIGINDQQWPALNAGVNGISELASGGGSTYKLETATLPGNDPELDKWSDAAQSWSQVTLLGYYAQTGVRVAVDPAGNPWVISSSGQISRQISVGNWTNVGSLSATDIGIGAQGSVWAIGQDHLVYLYNPAAGQWAQYPGVTASRIAVNNNGQPWVVTSAGTICQYTGTWTNISAPFTASTLAVGPSNAVWALGALDRSVWKYNGSGWDQYKNRGVALSVDYAGSPWVADTLGQLFKGKFRDILPDPLPLATNAFPAIRIRSGVSFAAVLVTNTTKAVQSGPFFLVPVALTNGVSLKNSAGTFHGLPYVVVPVGGAGSLQPGESTLVTLTFNNPSNGSVYFDPIVFLGNE